ncbi:competence pheromone ComX [Paenibacillus tarimensis]
MMMKQAIAQLKQCPEMLSLLMQGRISIIGISSLQQRALIEVLGEDLKYQKEGFWTPT